MPMRGWQRSGPEPKRRKTAPLTRSRSQKQPSPLTIQSFPHILDAVIEYASPEALRALRGTCHHIKDVIDQRLRAHVSLVVEGSTGRCWMDSPNWKRCKTDDERRSFLESVMMFDDGEPGLASNPPDEVLARTAIASLPLQTPPPRLQVLDIDADANAVWYDHSLSFGAHGDHASLERWLAGEIQAVQDRMARNEVWLEHDPPLARYMLRGKNADRRLAVPGAQPLRADVLGVYFCDVEGFGTALHRRQAHYDLCGEPFDAVFNVSLAPPATSVVDWFLGFPDLGHNRLTVLLTAPDFEEAARSLRPDFVYDLLGSLVYDYVRPCEGGRATIVGYETWSKHLLPEPPAGEYWDALAADKAEDWARSRLKWWIGERVQRLLRQQYLPPVDQPIRPYLHDPIKLLTLAEWREQIGDTYFQLLTDPTAKYYSKKPLPAFNAQSDA